MLASRLLRGAGVERLYVDDVFSAYTYTGNGSTQTITNGIDLAGKGGMVWTKCRSLPVSHGVTDSARGVSNSLFTNSTAAQAGSVNVDLYEFLPNGFSVKAPAWNIDTNSASQPYASWTFRKAPKFFDIVTYTGNGVLGRQISHALGIAPGMMLVKRTDTSAAWQIYHQSLGNGYALNFDTAASVASSLWDYTTPSSSSFTVFASTGVNATGGTYVAYLFAHDTSTDGLIQCGSFTTDGSGNASVNHGRAAGIQFAQIKASTTTGDWEMFDTTRTPAWSSSDARLRANLSNVEDSVTRLSASGTSVSFTGISASQTYVYVFVVAPT